MVIFHGKSVPEGHKGAIAHSEENGLLPRGNGSENNAAFLFLHNTLH